MTKGGKGSEIRPDYPNRYGNVNRNGKGELTSGGLKFPTTTKSFT